MAQFLAPTQGIALAHFIVSTDVERSRGFYREVLGCQAVLEGELSIVPRAARDGRIRVQHVHHSVKDALGSLSSGRLYLSRARLRLFHGDLIDVCQSPCA
jgi:hypothetical protein